MQNLFCKKKSYIKTYLSKLTVSTQSVYFGTTVIGETIQKKIQLVNKGALGTNFQVLSLKENQRAIENKHELEPKNDQSNDESIKIGEVITHFLFSLSLKHLHKP